MTVATHKCFFFLIIVLNEFSMQNNITDVIKHRMFSIRPVIKEILPYFGIINYFQTVTKLHLFAFQS